MFGRRRGGSTPVSQAAAAAAGQGPQAFARWFIEAAMNADQAYLREHDPKKIRMGTDIWEQINREGYLSGAPPESIVGLHITVANLYARRYEIDERPQDSDRALSYLRLAEQHVVPGSAEDALIKLSSANWLILRFRHTADGSDLDQAIAEYGQVIDMLPPGSANRALATGNLGRSLLNRHRLTGSAADLNRAQTLLTDAVIKMGPDHPAAPIVQDQWFSAMLESIKK
jgi:hypothetical protein